MSEKSQREAFLAYYLTALREKIAEAGLPLSAKTDRNAFVHFMKERHREGHEEIRALHLAGAGGAEVVHRITAWTDAVLTVLFEFAHTLTGLQAGEARCALLAIGGYGRGELNPYSDLDVMFLTRSGIDADSRDLSENCLYLMWDLNLDIGHGIRSIADCVSLAASDIKAKTSLIESRFLAGDRKCFEDFLAASRNKILHRDASGYLRTKIGDVHDRHKQFGGSLYMKEPHVKEGVGGLRDIHTAFWIAKIKYGVNSLEELQEQGVVSGKEEEILRHAKEFLWKVRNHLHYVSARRNDLLSMEMQDELAAFLKYRDLKHTQAVERCMRGYYLHTRNVHYFTSLLVNRCTASLQRKWFGGFSWKKKTVGSGFAIVGRQLCVPDGREEFFREDPVRLMEIFVLGQRYHVAPADATRQKVLSSLGLVNHAFRSTDRVTALFLQILGHGEKVVATLRQMHELRFLGKYLPEFGALTALVQHEIYHAYTVDEHTLMALEHLERLRGSPYPEEGFYAALFREVEKPALLFLALLLHDIGKAMGAGHVHRGGKAIPAIMHRMGFSRDDARAVEFLVRNHLVMAHLSQRRDLHDLKLIAQLARVVKNTERLRMLTLMTYCDSRGVGPDLWNAWKDSLLREIFLRTRDSLVSDTGQSMAEITASSLEKIRDRIRKAGTQAYGREETERILKSFSPAYLLSAPQPLVMKHLSMIRTVEQEGFAVHWEHVPEKGYTEMNICTYDSDTPGLFSRIAGMLASKGINILGARIDTTNRGVVIDCVHIVPPQESIREDPKYRREIQEAIRAVVQRTRRVEEALLEHRPPAYLRKKGKRKIPTRVRFDNEVSDEYTVIDVYAEDRIGLLYRMTAALADLGVHIHSAKVMTEMDRAVDAFYVTDIFGDKITDEGKLDGIREHLLESLARDREMLSPEGEPGDS